MSEAAVTPLRVVVVGTLASNPWAGMAWMHMQFVAGLRRLGHEAYYFETTSAWPYDPIRQRAVDDSAYAVPYLERVARRFGLDGRWAYRRSYSDKEWLGLPRRQAEQLLVDADLVLNISGATNLTTEGLEVGRLVYVGTDPGYDELTLAAGNEDTRTFVAEHDDVVTYGENIGTAKSPIPPLPGLRARTRQPILTDVWRDGQPTRPEFTTVCNWRQSGHDAEYEGVSYTWSKEQEFLKFVELPRLVDQPLELSTGLANMSAEDRRLLESHGWRLRDAHVFTTDPWPYRGYVQASRGEFTVAKDQNVRLKSGWFSERSACYLAAGRPVITQDTGFGEVLPVGQGLFACTTVEEAADAFQAVAADYERHSRAARALAEEYFRAETVLGRLLEDLGL
jgi:hypothetical protein